MECTVQWTGGDGMAMLASTGSGHLLTMDGAPASKPGDVGGHDLAPRPMEVLLAAAGGCTTFDIVMILKRGRQDVRGCTVKLSGERADTDPKVYTSIHMHYTVSGRGLTQAAVERAVQLSHDKYCSASIMLAKTATLTHTLEVIEV